MQETFSTADLESYLDEALPGEAMSKIEEALRCDPALVERLGKIIGRRDAGIHSLGEIWRRGRISCPAREELGSFLLGVLPEQTAAHITFHLETVACRYCAANLADLRARQAESNTAVDGRRRRYFQSSAGYLQKTQ